MSATEFSCPLCRTLASIFATPNFGRYKAVQCKSCGEFVISDRAAERIAPIKDEFSSWKAAIRSARPEQILLMIVEPVGSGEGLRAELVLRSSLRLHASGGQAM